MGGVLPAEAKAAARSEGGMSGITKLRQFGTHLKWKMGNKISAYRIRRAVRWETREAHRGEAA